MANFLLLLIAALLAALVVIQYRAYRKPIPAPIINIPAPAQQASFLHDVELHKEHRLCAECRLLVARYDHRGVCPNCVSEGK